MNQPSLPCGREQGSKRLSLVAFHLIGISLCGDMFHILLEHSGEAGSNEALPGPLVHFLEPLF